MLTMTVASVNSTIFIMEASLTHLDWEIGLLECSQMSPLSLTNVKTCSAIPVSLIGNISFIMTMMIRKMMQTNKMAIISWFAAAFWI